MSEEKRPFTIVFYYGEDDKSIHQIYGKSVEHIARIIHMAAGNFLELPTVRADFESVNLSLVRRFVIHDDENE